MGRLQYAAYEGPIERLAVWMQERSDEGYEFLAHSPVVRTVWNDPKNGLQFGESTSHTVIMRRYVSTVDA